ncbi:hypothetical protein KI659_07460 [Litoribacter alkaliphilus]|uniref:Right-handed parallel beta-helix repeat-containing protein n=1 Tax=Litoribacter ruber TaxID=702568 RepID=A0AAP2G113_9BACT|nr:hypothetical protein [Litoribacter alkaliphilus]MBS9523849.1 hypothetical protein [Litoribacter alkaliphilus]
MKKSILKFWMMGALLAGAIACSDEQNPVVDPVEDDQDQSVEPTQDNMFGEVSGVWAANETYIVTGDIVIPEGESLTLEEGVTVIMDGDGRQGSSPEIVVRGSLYSYGTESNRVRITVAEDKRVPANHFAGLWGGISTTETVQDLVFEYTDIEFSGAPGEAHNPIVQEGEIDEGEPRYAIYMQDDGLTSNLILWHTRIAFSKDDAIRLNGAKTLIAHSIFELNGETGGEAMNAKSGTVGDFCFNLMYGVATNGLKVANSKGREPQADNYYYNNTIVNSGWRRAQSGRGGSLNFENGARGLSFNNLVVNSRYGLRMVPPDNQPDMANITFGHQFYYGDEEIIVEEFYPSNGTIGREGGQAIPASDVAGGVAENDPMFVNYQLGQGFNIEAAREGSSTAPLGNADFRLQAGSPALTGAYTGFEPRYASYEVNGKTYETPRPAEFFGAFGQGN